MNATELPSDADLVKIARDQITSLRDQHAAFARLVERWQSRVFALAVERLRDPDDAADVAQDSLMTAWVRLAQLRDPAAFGGWLRRIVLSSCNRRRRQAREVSEANPDAMPLFPAVAPGDYRTLLSAAIATLPEGDRQVTVLFYFLGHDLKEVARLLGLRAGTVAKRLHSARLKIRRVLPPFVRYDFLRVRPTRSLVERIRLGMLDEYVGDYRFERRPSHVVRIVREGDALVGYGNGQRNLLATIGDDAMITSHFDGEGRFGRDRRGRITHFIYYEFGKRLGKAKRVSSRADTRLRL